MHADDGKTARHFYIPTTQRPVRILRIAEEQDMSTVCIGFTHRPAGISVGYNAFVKRPTGVIHRLFSAEPYPAYRMDVSDVVDTGDSWGLAVFLAHAQHAAGASSAADLVWATATVSHDLRVGAVASVSEKIRLSLDLFEDALEDGRGIFVILSGENEADLEPDARGMLQGLGIVPHFVSRVDEALALVGLPLVEARAATRQAGSEERWAGNPYRNLQPFEREHRAVFFGRNRALEEATVKLRRAAARGLPLLVVHGPSGAGKSSFVRAGLVAELSAAAPEGRAVPVRVLSPKSAVTPLAALLGALGGMAGERGGAAVTFATVGEATASVGRSSYGDAEAGRPTMLLVIDQFEEVFDPSSDPKDIAAFDDALSKVVATGRVWVVATVRSDALGQFGRMPGFSAIATDDRLYRLEAPRRSELASIIRDPAAKAGLRFEDPSIVDDLVDVAYRSPDSLPLLQAALFRLFDFARAEGTLTRATLDVVGGFEGAISRWADEAHAQIVEAGFDDVGVDAALASLVRIDPDVHAPLARVQPLVPGSPAFGVLSALVERRLVTRFEGVDVPRVRLAHEALMTHWPRMAALIRRLSGAMALRDDLERRVAAWEESGRDAAELIHGAARLDAAESFLRERRLPVSTPVEEYVAASLGAAEAERLRREAETASALERARLAADNAEIARRAAESETRAAEAKLESAESARRASDAEKARSETAKLAAETEARSGRRLIRTLAAGVVGLTATAGAAGWFWNSSVVNEGRAAAERDQKERQLEAAEANLTRFLANAANDRASTHPEFARALVLERIPEGATFNGATTTAQREAEIALRNVKSVDPVRVLMAGYSYKAPIWSPDGKRLALLEDNRVSLWEAATGRNVGTYGFGEMPSSASWSPSSDRLLVQFATLPASVLDVASGSVTPMKGSSGPLFSATAESPWSPDGRFLVLPDAEGFLGLWDSATLSPRGKVAPRLKDSSAHWSPDSKTLANLGKEALWTLDTATLATTRRRVSPGGSFERLVFKPDSSGFATTSDDGTVALWDMRFDKPTQVIGDFVRKEPLSGVQVAWNTDGTVLATWPTYFRVQADGGYLMLRLWDTGPSGATPRSQQLMLDPTDELLGVHFTREGTIVYETEKQVSMAVLSDLGLAVSVDKSVIGEQARVSLNPASSEPLEMASASKLAPAAIFSWRGVPFETPLDRERAASFRKLADEDRGNYGLVAETPAVAASDRATDRCDFAAGHPYDPAIGRRGASFTRIDPAAAVPACEAAVKEQPDSARLRYQLGRALQKAGRSDEAFAAFSRAAEMHHAMAMVSLGGMVLEGSGTKEDPARGRALMVEALRLGAPNAAGALGGLLAAGVGGPASKADAVATWKRGAELGDAAAHERLATMFEEGLEGAPPDLPNALLHFTIATELFERIGEEGAATSARLRRGSLARSMDPEVVARQWAKSRELLVAPHGGSPSAP